MIVLPKPPQEVVLGSFKNDANAANTMNDKIFTSNKKTGPVFDVGFKEGKTFVKVGYRHVF